MVPANVEYIGNVSLKISSYFADIVENWHTKKIDNQKVWLVKNDTVNYGLAVHFLNERLKSINTTQKMDTLNDKIIKLVRYWANNGYIHPESRGVPL